MHHASKFMHHRAPKLFGPNISRALLQRNKDNIKQRLMRMVARPQLIIAAYYRAAQQDTDPEARRPRRDTSIEGAVERECAINPDKALGLLEPRSIADLSNTQVTSELKPTVGQGKALRFMARADDAHVPFIDPKFMLKIARQRMKPGKAPDLTGWTRELFLAAMYTGAEKIYGFGSDNTPVFAESCQGLLPGDLFAGFGFSLDTAGLRNEKTCAYVDDVQIAGSFNELDRIAERAASECGRATCGPKTIKLKARETGPAGAAILLGAIIENAQSRRRYLQQENEAVQHTGESDHRLQDIQAVSAAAHEGA
jgi:hypothetical protein